MKKLNSTTAAPEKNTFQKLVDRGYELHRKINALNWELNQIKDLLKTEAISRPQDHVPLSSGEGKEWIIRSKSVECHIVFPAPRLTTEFDPKEASFIQIKTLAGDHFDLLFKKLTLFRVAAPEQFRTQVSGYLSPLNASALLDLCSSPSSPRTTWKENPSKTA